jgi:hypothetical protein
VTNKNLDKIKEDYKKKVETLRDEFYNKEEEYLNNLGKKITREMLREGIWNVIYFIGDDFRLEGDPKDFPMLIELIKGLSWLDKVRILIDDNVYGLYYSEKELFLCGLTDWDDDGNKTGTMDLLPLIKKFNLRIDFTKANKDFKYDEIHLEKIRSILNHLKEFITF